MADKIYLDANGKPINMAPSIQPPGGNSEEGMDRDKPVKKWLDVKGQPINISQGLGLTQPGSTVPDVAGKVATLPNPSDTLPYMGRFMANAMPALGGALATPESFGAGTIPGIAAGSFIKRGLQAISPKYFGSSDPASVSGDLADTATDIAGNLIPYGGKAAADVLAPTKGNIAKMLASKFMKGSPAVQSEVDRTIGAQAESKLAPNSYAIETAASNVKDNPDLTTYAQRGNKDFSHPAVAPGTIGADLKNIPYEQGKDVANTYIGKTADRALSDVTQVRNFKIATGEPYTIEQLAVNKAIKSGYSGTGRLDPDKILAELNGKSSDVYGEAIRSDTRKNLETFLTQAKQMQVDPTTNSHSLISMLGNKPILSLPGIGVGGSIGGMMGHPVYGAMAGGATSIALGESAISKLMANPEIAKLTIQAMKTPLGDQSSKMISQVILNGLRGTEVYVMTPDGEQEKALVSQDGKLTYPKPR